MSIDTTVTDLSSTINSTLDYIGAECESGFAFDWIYDILPDMLFEGKQEEIEEALQIIMKEFCGMFGFDVGPPT